MKRLVIVVAALVLVVLGSFAGGVSATTLITGAQVKDGSLTGADVKSSSIPPGDLTVHPRTFKWTAYYAGDGSTTVAHLTSTQTLPKSSLVRVVSFSFSPVAPCVRHGDAANPANNTGQYSVQVTLANGPLLLAHYSATTGSNNVSFPANTTIGVEGYTGSSLPHLMVQANCHDFTGNTPAAAVPSFSLTVVFQVTAVNTAGAVAFH